MNEESAALVTPLEERRQRLRTLVLARWIGFAFGLAQVAAYRTLAYPPGIRASAYALLGLLVAINIAFMLALPRLASETQAIRLSVVSLVADTAVLSAFVWLFAFDPISALFALLILLPIEGALHFQLAGAAWTWLATAVLYAGREWFGTRYDNPFEVDSLMYRVGVIGIVALVVGLLARDLTRQREETIRALQSSQEAEQWRARLVTMLAHDIRSPLGGVRTSLTTIRDLGTQLSAQDIERTLSAGVRQVDRLLVLSRDLLDRARSEGAGLELAPEEVALAELVERTVILAGLDPEDVMATVPPDLQLRADPARFEQILYNLLDNARRYGRSPILVTAANEGHEVEITVRDHGGGLDPGVAERIFQPFATSGEAGSVGLGLWIVGELVEAHGGTVTCEQAEPGARFRIRLPA